MTDDTAVTLLDQSAVERALARMAREILERNEGTRNLVLLGIRRRGVELAERIRGSIESEEETEISSGAIDITLYRDDLAQIGPRPVIGESTLPMDGIDDRTVVIVDDVFFTGRTARAAMNELMDWGRPSRILLCVLVDRGGRELPIQPDIVGRQSQCAPASEGGRTGAGDRWLPCRRNLSVGRGDDLNPTVSALGKDLVGLEELSADQILSILDTAEPFKEISERRIKKVPVLRGKTIVNLFMEPSTRTRISFEFAEKRLSADTVNIEASGSSVVKGRPWWIRRATSKRCASTWW